MPRKDSNRLMGTTLATALLLSGCVSRHEHTITVSDRIDRSWAGQCIRVRFEPEAAPFDPSSVTLNGPDGPLPVQLAAIEKDANAALVQAADLHFIVPRLDALQTNTYVVEYGPKARDADAPRSESSLTVTTRDDRVSIDSGELTATFVTGTLAWDTPADAADVPGPLVAMRLPGGDPFGGSLFYGATPIQSWRGELTAAGPVFAEVTHRIEYAGGTLVTVTARVTAGDSAVRWDMTTTGGSLSNDGLRFDLSTGLPPLTFIFKGEHYSKRGEIVGREVKPGDLVTLPLADYPDEVVTRLTPWNDWWDDTTQTRIVLRAGEGNAALALIAREPGRWVEPAAPGTRVSHGKVYPRMMPVRKLLSGAIAVDANLTDGYRAWTVNVRTVPAGDEAPNLDAAAMLRQAPATRTGYALNRVLDWVLEWPGDRGKHPRVYATAADIDAYRERTDPDPDELAELLRLGAGPPTRVHWRHDTMAMRAWLLTGRQEVAEQVQLADHLRHHLGKLGNYDTMRNASRVAILYDLLIDSDLITPKERPVLQAQMGYLGYTLASPANWSMERGYCSGNLNMSVAHILNLGVLAATIPEHPMAEQWSAGALAMMEQWLDRNVGPAGEFLGSGESQANYAPVSAAKLITYGIVATRAGFRNFVDDPRLRALIQCLAKQMTPPDVRFPSPEGMPIAGTPASGRGPKGQRHGLAGMMARATAGHDPEFSATMQWAWSRTGYSTGYLRDRMAGLESVYMNPALPSSAPNWTLDVFPRLGAIMRHGLGSDHEWYINFLLEPSDLTAFHSESGGFPGIWARGVPISVRFGGKGYGERDELLISRVLPAREVGTDEGQRRQRMMGIGGPRRLLATSALPRQHYVAARIPMQSRHHRRAHYDLMDLPAWPAIEREGALPIDWQRQILFVRDDEPAGINYLVLRDTVSGNQPTMWQFWTLSEKIATPDDLQNLESFLADKPGETARDARPIKGDRFTALGQWRVDVDYYIASPTNTPRHTLRWGTHYHIPMKHAEFQDMLHLQRPDDGAYFVAIFPRDRQAAAPRFRTLAEGYVIRIDTEDMIDHVFLSDAVREADAGAIRFEGTAASVRTRDNGRRDLSLGAAGSIVLGTTVWLRCEQPAALTIRPDAWTVTVPADRRREHTLQLRSPRALTLRAPSHGARLKRDADDYILTLPSGVFRSDLDVRPE